MPKPTLCLEESCTNPIAQPSGPGRVRLFCSDGCRVRHSQKQAKARMPRAELASELECLRGDIAELHGEMAGMRQDIQSLIRALVRKRD